MIFAAVRDRVLFYAFWGAAIGFAVGVWAVFGWGLERFAK